MKLCTNSKKWKYLIGVVTFEKFSQNYFSKYSFTYFPYCNMMIHDESMDV